MVNTKRPAKEVIAAMAQQKVIIGRVWPAMPTYTRITVGTSEEMERFQVAFQNVMKGTAFGQLGPVARLTFRLRQLMGLVLPSLGWAQAVTPRGFTFPRMNSMMESIGVPG